MATLDIAVDVSIAAAPADVAGVMFDPQREPEWITEIKKVELIDPAMQVGARVRHTASVMGREVSWTSAVEVVHFPHALTLRIAEGSFNGQLSYQIQRDATGSAVRLQARGETAPLGFLPMSLVEGAIRKALVADLGRLKALVETAHAAAKR